MSFGAWVVLILGGGVLWGGLGYFVAVFIQAARRENENSGGSGRVR